MRSTRCSHLLAEIVRLDRGHHRRVAGDSEIAEHIKIATRAHQTMIWSRVWQVNALRSLLREYYPAALAAFGADLASADALAVLAGAEPGAGPAVVPGPDRDPAPQGWSTTQRHAHRSQDPRRAELGSADRPARCGARLRRERIGTDRGADGDGRGVGRAASSRTLMKSGHLRRHHGNCAVARNSSGVALPKPKNSR